MNWNKYTSILTLFLILFVMTGSAMAADDGDGVTVRDASGNDITNENHKIVDDDDNSNRATVSDDDEEEEDSNNGGIEPDDIYSDTKVLGQDVKDGDFLDFIDVKKWISLIFVNGYVSAVAGLVFAVVGLIIIFGTSLSILKNGASAACVMLSTDGDADEKLEKVHVTERSTVAVMRGVGVTFVAMSAFCFMISFLS